MGFNIGSVLSGLHLPKIDLGNIGKAVLDEGKKILKDVVKDEFTLSNQPGKVLSEDLNLNILGENIRLPNPINKLANKYLGKADDFLNKFGVNLDFKKMAESFFHLPTEKGGTVTVPNVKTRAAGKNTGVAELAAATGSAGADATGGGAPQVTSSAATGVSAGAEATGGASAPATSGDYTDGLINAFGGADSKYQAALGGIKEGMSPEALFKAQQDVQKYQQLMQTLTDLLKKDDEMKKAIISNLR